MLTFEQLDIIAREVAATAPVWQRWDVYQEGWLRFLRYPPRTFGGAHLMARHARNDLWRGERRHAHTDIDDVPDEALHLSLIHISEPTRLGMISYAVFCLKKKKRKKRKEYTRFSK